MPKSVSPSPSRASQRQASITASATAPAKCTRLTIPEVIKEQICSFVLESTQSGTPISGKAIQAWAKLKFGYNFPQSTISTLLSSRGITIKRNGCRGRPPIAKPAALAVGASAAAGGVVQGQAPHMSNSQPSYTLDYSGSPHGLKGQGQLNRSQRSFYDNRSARSARTGLLLCDLQRLADFRLRSSSSEYPDVEIAILEDVYNLLRIGEFRITTAWLFAQAQALFYQHQQQNQHKLSPSSTTSITSSKYVNQFLCQLYNKYYLTNTIAEHLVYHKITYEQLIQKLSIKFPALKFAPIPLDSHFSTSTLPVTTTAPYDSALPLYHPIMPLANPYPSPTAAADYQFHVPVLSLDRHYYLGSPDSNDLQTQPPTLPDSAHQQLLQDWSSAAMANCFASANPHQPWMSEYNKSDCSSSLKRMQPSETLPTKISHLPPTPPFVSPDEDSLPHLILQTSVYDNNQLNLNF